MNYGLIGEKLGHSFSKEIHEALADYSYELCPLNPKEFHAFMQARQFKAINVTIPYKKEVLPYLDEIDTAAKTIGAVNTIVHKNGKLKGYNTDYDGFRYMLIKHHIKVSDKKVLILGNGGASAAVQAVIKDADAKELIVVSPSAKNGAISFAEVYAKHRDVQIIINTSPKGMYPHVDEAPIDLQDFPSCEAVLDIIYNPLVTRLGLQAKKYGIPFVGGLEMLVAQAVYAVNYFLDASFTNADIDRLYQKILWEKINIVLIGMPSAGKSSIAKELSKAMQMTYLDSDEEIVKTYRQSIPEIFTQEGEAGFRQKEQAVIASIALQNHCVLATGGGAILNEANMNALAQNGIIVFLDRNIEKLTCDATRPLSKDPQTLKQMYRQRLPLYQRYAMITIKNNEDLATCVKAIRTQLKQWITNRKDENI